MMLVVHLALLIHLTSGKLVELVFDQQSVSLGGGP
jgi:hypothetical protein